MSAGPFLPALPLGLDPGAEQITDPLGVEQGAVYTIVGPDGTRAVLNNPADRDFVGYLTEPPSGLERAGIRESSDLIPEGDGGIHGVFRYDRLPFTLTGVIPPAMAPGVVVGTWLTRQAKLLRATNAMRGDSVLQWTPSEAPPVYVSFRQQQPTRITGRRPKAFLVAGVAEDPLVYSQALSTSSVTPGGAVSGGMSSPVTSPVSSVLGIAGQLNVTNAGTADTWPVLTIYGPVTNPVLTNFTTGQSIYLTYTLLAGEYLVVDTNPRRRTVRLGDTANRYSAYDYTRSAWWALEPGVNDLRLSASSYGSGAMLVVQWRDAWG